MRFLKPAAAVLITCALLFAAFGTWFYSALTSKIAHKKSDEFISIEKGQPPDRIISHLEREGIVSSAFAAKIYVRILADSSKLQAGDYKFKSPISAIEVIRELETGKQRTKKITIPEGWTRFEIAKRIAANFPVDPPMDEKAVLYLMNDTSLIRDIDPSAENLEGYLYPTTYEFALESTPQDVIKQMVGQFRKKWKREWTEKAQASGLTNHQVVTIASLVENESKVESERRIVASVIHNRLRRGMALGIDATNVYIAKLLGRWDGVINKSDIEINHPYNTRKISGLPPGPISSASESSLEAALNPAQTNFLYYVLDVDKNDGSHNFYDSAAGFEQGKAKYQRWLSEQRRAN